MAQTKTSTASRRRTSSKSGGGGDPAAEVTGILSVADAAHALGIGSSTAYDAIRAGTFPVRTVNLAGRKKVLRADLDRFLNGSASE